MKMMTSTSIGFIGLGIMGKGMLKNLLTKLDPALSYVVWNRSVDVSQEVSSLYPGRITVVDSAADVVRQCEVTFSMLSTMEASAAVVSLFSSMSTSMILTNVLSFNSLMLQTLVSMLLLHLVKL